MSKKLKVVSIVHYWLPQLTNKYDSALEHIKTSDMSSGNLKPNLNVNLLTLWREE